jgi:hypothetical protein
MQVEILKFLLDASAHFSDMRGVTDTPIAPVDLQAVDRELPDCDWFELVERHSGCARSQQAGLWEQQIPALEF